SELAGVFPEASRLAARLYGRSGGRLSASRICRPDTDVRRGGVPSPVRGSLGPPGRPAARQEGVRRGGWAVLCGAVLSEAGDRSVQLLSAERVVRRGAGDRGGGVAAEPRGGAGTVPEGRRRAQDEGVCVEGEP